MTTELQPRVTVVGFNYSPELTGIAVYTSGLCVGLADLGADVRAITTFPHYPAWKISEGYDGHRRNEVISNVDVRRIRPYMPQNPAGIKRLVMEIRFGLASILTPWGRPDVIVLVSPALFAAWFAMVRAKLSPRRPRVVVWVQDLYSVGVTETGALNGRGARVIAKIESALLKTSDEVVVIHDRFKRHVSERLGVPSEKISVIRNWTHIQELAVDRQFYRNFFGWEEDEIVVLHAGNMGAKQALENVVEAARLASRSSSRIRFVLLGNGNQRDSLEKLGAGVQKLVFLDSLGDEQFQGAMAAADILLVNEKPGVTDMAVPSKLTSYFAAGRPVIAATDAGSITSEEISAAGAGIRVDAGNASALLAAAIGLGRDKQTSEAYGRNAGVFQKQVLSQEFALVHYAEIINRLAVERGR